jgi:hypothetical protein
MKVGALMSARRDVAEPDRLRLDAVAAEAGEPPVIQRLSADVSKRVRPTLDRSLQLVGAVSCFVD